MQERTFIEELKYQYKHGGMHIRLVFINTIVFLVIGIALVVMRLSKLHDSGIGDLLEGMFTLKTDLPEFIKHPWGLFTSMFAHFEFVHFLFNMIFLFFSGMMFLQFFTSRRLLHVYIWGGIAGGLFEILAHLIFPGLENGAVVVGASASITALFITLAFYRPSLRVNVFGLFPIPLMVIAGLFLISDLVGLGQPDGVAHFAHIGGALVGMLSVQNINSSTNVMNMSERFTQWISTGFSRLIRPQQKLRVEKGGRAVKSDEEYAVEAKERQKRIDAILDKISKSGYESLTKAEKEFLFSQSKK